MQKVLLGLRSWYFKDGKLNSPLYDSEWKGGELIAEDWSTSKALRGQGGIHASNLPDGDWKTKPNMEEWPSVWNCFGTVQALGEVVRGTAGWRAQKSRIIEIVARDEIAKEIEEKFPHVIVHRATEEMYLKWKTLDEGFLHRPMSAFPLFTRKPNNNPTPYRIVYRERGKARGASIKRFKTMQRARSYADRSIRSRNVGDVLVIYIDCPSQPFDARYYIKNVDGSTYQCRRDGTKWKEMCKLLEKVHKGGAYAFRKKR